MTLTQEEQQRYRRHFSLPNIGISGQHKLKAAKVLCVGAGGLASPALLYLCAAGIGTIGIVDDDNVELSNLQRQVLYSANDVGTAKVFAAQSRLLAQNPDLQVTAHQQRLTASNALDLIAAYDIILDCTDNFVARYLISEGCFKLNKPHVYAGVSQFLGECSVFIGGRGACYRCLYPASPPADLSLNCSEAGVLGILPGLLGMIQATEALKLALGLETSLLGKVLRVNTLTLSFDEFILQPDPDCALCAVGVLSHHLPEYGAMTNEQKQFAAITPQQLQALQQQRQDFILLDVREPQEYQLCHLDGAVLIPLAELDTRLAELDQAKPMIIYCKHDGRSQLAAAWLANTGFTQVKYLKGGISAWAQQIDATMAVY